jgi:hypothetical protein
VDTAVRPNPPGRSGLVMRAERGDRVIDAVALAMVGVLAVAVTISGVHTGWRLMDADELVYRRTLLAMQHGQGFYQAQRAALILKEHRPPTSVRAIRPPTLYLVLRWLPEASWRWIVGFVYLADLSLAWRLARRYGAFAGAVAVSIAAIWLFGFTGYLFLHAEVWGLPLFLAGALALRSRRVWTAVVLFLAAACMRELYLTGLLAGLALAVASGWRVRPLAPRAWLGRVGPWLAGMFLAAMLYAVHSAFAETVLSAHGYNARFGNEHRTTAFLLRLMAPIVSSGGETFGIAVTVIGLIGVARVARRDPAAVVCGVSGAFLLAASVWATRVYWNACWAIPLAAFAPVAFGAGAVAPHMPAPRDGDDDAGSRVTDWEDPVAMGPLVHTNG